MTGIRIGSARYLLGPLACPRCGMADRTHLECYGVLRPVCQSPRCRASWTAVRIPPGATGELVLAVYGEDVARAVLMALRPDDDPCSWDALRVAPLPVTGEAVYVQRAPDEPEPIVGWHVAARILHAILGAA